MSWVGAAAANHASTEALCAGGRGITYRELAAHVHALEAALAREGIARGEALAVLALAAREIALLLHAAQ
ncbi:MAG TPA: hypothetical protein VFT98_20555, partial [Myxococcota bacterium]|nr:hypothetical protein [Myxococcota bacterium]